MKPIDLTIENSESPLFTSEEYYRFTRLETLLDSLAWPLMTYGITSHLLWDLGLEHHETS